MAKRSDFAQKLLDDLRLRKERMAASSNPSKTTPIDAYAYSKQTYRGSGETKHSTGSRSRSKSVDVSHIVPYQSSAQIDLPMALAFALENGGKLDSPGNNSIFSFLHQIGRESFRKVERRSISDRHQSSTSPFSHLHIKEISKGAEKLNQILKACSKGRNLDRYSVQMGQELLKGALDLEESLRMLVNMQEASDYMMISPRRKTRLTLLEDDNDNITTQQKQLELPMFSFDKPSHQVAGSGYLRDTPNPNSVSHTPRASYDLDVKKEHSSSSGRIPSVIVRLMGLDELPENVDPKSSTHSSTRIAEKNAQNLKQKPVQVHKSPVEGDKWKDLEVTNSVPSSAETHVKMKKQNDVTEKERKHDIAKQRGTEKSEIKKQTRPEAVVTVQENKASKRLNQQKPRSHLGIQQPYMLRRSEPQEGKEQQRAKQKMQARKKQKGNQVILSKPKQDATGLGKLQQHINHIKPSKKDPRERIDALPSKWFQDNRHHEDVRDGSSIEKNSSEKYLESEPDITLPFVQEKHVHAPVERKTENTAPSKMDEIVGDEGLAIKEPEIAASSDSSRRRAPEAIKDQRGQAQISGGEEAILDEIASDANNRTEEGNDTCYPSKMAIREPFTERENNLKQILMKSQLFLDTAEALLKLNICFGILNSGGQDCLNEDSKLVLDCGYELMKRKGTRQELSVHPYTKICITSTKINSLDDLVKQLDKDFEVLKVYGRNGKKDCNAQDYVPKMIESDIQDRYPDMNCMWDCGWNETAHAFHEKDDVVRDVERRVFNGLIDEIVRDLFHI